MFEEGKEVPTPASCRVANLLTPLAVKAGNKCKNADDLLKKGYEHSAAYIPIQKTLSALS